LKKLDTGESQICPDKLLPLYLQKGQKVIFFSQKDLPVISKHHFFKYQTFPHQSS